MSVAAAKGPKTKTTAQRSVPPLAVARKLRAPRVVEHRLPNGLRVLVIRKAGIPVVEARLRLPLLSVDRASYAKARLLEETMLKGTSTYSALDFEQQLGLLGGGISIGVDRDRLSVGGMTLSQHLPRFLELMSDALQHATYPSDAVIAERGRLVERLSVANSSAGVVASKTLARNLFADHPYAVLMPEAEDLAATSPAMVRGMHRRRVIPAGAVLVLVGDLSPARAIAVAQRAFDGWSGKTPRSKVPAMNARTSGPVVLVDRPGSVQSSIHLAGLGLGRYDDLHPAQMVANMIFGGNFSSRLVANLREDKGYTYSPHSSLDLAPQATTFSISADVATDVTAASLAEISYELSRMVVTTVTADELDSARQYLIGSVALSQSSQAGLASTTANLEFAGASLQWLRDLLVKIADVTIDDVHEAAMKIMQPTQIRTVVVGDASQVEPSLRAIVDVERQPMREAT
ncbi:putative Zn-dependent peptidase [Antricoccus suffuscus]|uniref:Putative Zn-dependent peptidase n=1 Tax=Antricoccus suffuscus TaxID=1629062 RepID=A0A2T0ZR15_9ACTN|nr:pitrilysin family protein [Antricoccus suffuscus]PRZ38548.1 putative Zn-dependent peptidase [Antricoccus suffuscus]